MIFGKCRETLVMTVAWAALGLLGQTPPPVPFDSAPVVAPPAVTGKPKLSPLTAEPDWKRLEAYGNILSKEEFEAAITSIYSSRGAFKAPWQVEADALVVETTAGQTMRIPFRSPSAVETKLPRFWRRPSELPQLKAGEPVLTGLHIALDPGHIGGGYALMEERWLSMIPGTSIQEGTLSLQIAMVLKAKLESLGARVTLVRQNEAPVTSAKPQELREAAKQVLAEAGIANPQEAYDPASGDAKLLTIQWQSEKLFYRVSEIRARAKKVNDELKPDLTLCLHLNAEPWGDPKQPRFVMENHFHLLINGCYSPDELTFDDVRFEMLNRVFGRMHEEEKSLADPIAKAMAESTHLPPFVYPGNNARRVDVNPYVYARNLLANRLYQCPVIYLEPYVMNNEQTYKRLLLGHYIGRTILGEELVTSPIEDYAQGVASGLAEYYQKARKGWQ
jgi:N-acetylmuramoyl-L-alanine amidase